MKNVDVIIVNYRAAELTKKAIESVLNDPNLHEVLVVDNASPGDDLGILQAFTKDKPVKMVVSDKNLGFGQGNNLAVKQATAPYLFFLNCDAELFEGTLSDLVTELEKNPKLGLVAPKVFLPDRTTVQRDAQGIFPTVGRLLSGRTKKYEQSAEPDWISGVAFMARTEDFRRLGAFNPDYFMYYEDIYLCWKYRQAGLNIKVNDRVKIFHLGGASHSSTPEQKKNYFRSQETYLKKIGTSKIALGLYRAARWLYGRKY